MPILIGDDACGAAPAAVTPIAAIAAAAISAPPARKRRFTCSPFGSVSQTIRRRSRQCLGFDRKPIRVNFTLSPLLLTHSGRGLTVVGLAVGPLIGNH